GHPAQLHLQEIARGRARDVAGEELVLPLRAQGRVEAVWLGGEREHVAGGARAGRQIFQDGAGDPVVEVFRELDAVLGGLVVADAGAVAARAAIDGDVGRRGEGAAPLDVV